MTNLERFVASFFNAEVGLRYLPRILEGMLVTLGLGLAVIAAGVAAGLALATVRAMRVPFTGWAIVGFADIFRALPPLVVIIVLYFAFPYIGMPMSAFVATWISLSLVLAAFAEEVFWAGILSVHRDQWSAGLSLGLSRWKTLRHVILPQALRLTVPPLTNRVISITKGTALGSVVALHEILNVSSSGASEAGNPTPLTLGALAYLILFIPFVWFGRSLEKRYAWKR
ncbi:MAG: amino acid ABC transporter permease [Burkholderiales bacterium]